MRNKSALAQKIKVGAQKRVTNLTASSVKNQCKKAPFSYKLPRKKLQPARKGLILKYIIPDFNSLNSY